MYSGLETKIKTQGETIVELEDRIKSCTEEIKKVRDIHVCVIIFKHTVHLYCYGIYNSTLYLYVIRVLM